ncbi:MAG: glycosyltransferase family 2 protein [Pirellulaceae bacterium]
MTSSDVAGPSLIVAENPVVSIIVPAFNRNETLPRSLMSVAKQTFQKFEIIIIDDGSTQSLAPVVSSFEDSRIRLLVHKKNRGANAARNTGIRVAKGKYIAFLDSDDEWHEEKLAVQVNAMEHAPSSVGAHYTGYTAYLEDGRIQCERNPVLSGNLLPSLIRGNIIGTLSTLMVRRSVLGAVNGFDEDLPSAQDWDLYIRIAKICEFATVGDSLVCYRLGRDSITRNMRAKARGLQMALEKHGKELSRERRAFARQLAGAGKYYCRAGSCSEGRQMFLRAIRSHPFAMRAYLYLLVSLLGGRTFERAASFRKKLSPFF